MSARIYVHVTRKLVLDGDDNPVLVATDDTLSVPNCSELTFFATGLSLNFKLGKMLLGLRVQQGINLFGMRVDPLGLLVVFVVQGLHLLGKRDLYYSGPLIINYFHTCQEVQSKQHGLI